MDSDNLNLAETDFKGKEEDDNYKLIIISLYNLIVENIDFDLFTQLLYS